MTIPINDWRFNWQIPPNTKVPWMVGVGAKSAHFLSATWPRHFFFVRVLAAKWALPGSFTQPRGMHMKIYDVSFGFPWVAVCLGHCLRGFLSTVLKGLHSMTPGTGIKQQRMLQLMCAAMGALENIYVFQMRVAPWNVHITSMFWCPAVVSGSQCCQETLCSPSRSGGCPRQTKHFDQLCRVFLFLGCYHHSHHSQIIACEYSRPISKNHYGSMRKMGTSIMVVQLFDLTYSSKFLGTHRDGKSNSQNTSPRHQIVLGKKETDPGFCPSGRQSVLRPDRQPPDGFPHSAEQIYQGSSGYSGRWSRKFVKTISLCSCGLKHTFYVYQSICLSICRSICIYVNKYVCYNIYYNIYIY